MTSFEQRLPELNLFDGGFPLKLPDRMSEAFS
jgi:hypothetical protein